jgi:putative ABC transport system ATP-binding protein
MIVVRDLHRRFGKTVALAGVDLTIERGEIVAISGPSGSGKSTLLHLVAALDRADSGSIEVNGQPIHGRRRLNAYRRSQIGLVFQLHNLIPNLSAAQNVEVAMFGTGRSGSDRRARAEELLGLVGLSHRGGSRPPTMSGGERQRVAVARSLANYPPLLLADEPTGSLDDESASRVIDVLIELRRTNGLTVVIVNHDPRVANVVDRTICIVAGRVTQPAR